MQNDTKIRFAVLDLLHIAGGTSSSSSNCLRLLIALLLVFTFPAFLLGQVDLGTIADGITDPTGSVIPSVVVMATQVATGASKKSVSNNLGFYSLQQLPVGACIVNFRKAYESRGDTMSSFRGRDGS